MDSENFDTDKKKKSSMDVKNIIAQIKMEKEQKTKNNSNLSLRENQTKNKKKLDNNELLKRLQRLEEAVGFLTVDKKLESKDTTKKIVDILSNKSDDEVTKIYNKFQEEENYDKINNYHLDLEDEEISTKRNRIENLDIELPRKNLNKYYHNSLFTPNRIRSVDYGVNTTGELLKLFSKKKSHEMYHPNTSFGSNKNLNKQLYKINPKTSKFDISSEREKEKKYKSFNLFKSHLQSSEKKKKKKNIDSSQRPIHKSNEKNKTKNSNKNIDTNKKNMRNSNEKIKRKSKNSCTVRKKNNYQLDIWKNRLDRSYRDQFHYRKAINTKMKQKSEQRIKKMGSFLTKKKKNNKPEVQVRTQSENDHQAYQKALKTIEDLEKENKKLRMKNQSLEKDKLGLNSTIQDLSYELDDLKHQRNNELRQKDKIIKDLEDNLKLQKENIDEDFIHFDTRDLDDEDLKNLKIAVDCECQRRNLNYPTEIRIPDVKFVIDMKKTNNNESNGKNNNKDMKRNSTIKELPEEYIYDSIESPLKSMKSEKNSTVRLNNSSQKKRKNDFE